MARNDDARVRHVRFSRMSVADWSIRWRRGWRLAALAMVAAAVVVPLAFGDSGGAGALQLRAEFSWTFSVQRDDTTCPAETPALAICQPHVSSATVPGLGRVSASYVYTVLASASCAGSSAQVLGYSARLAVPGKGEIDFAVGGLPNCFPAPSAAIQSTTQPFTVTGGSGAYAGATGSGTLKHAGVPGLAGTHGRDLWTGTLEVPGLEFDISPPTISGAVSKTVRAPRGAKRVRVTYKVAASDAASTASVGCRPPSGSFFKLGKTPVTCTATDTSGNTTVARFTVTVRGKR
jgi:hypothetical protein